MSLQGFYLTYLKHWCFLPLSIVQAGIKANTGKEFHPPHQQNYLTWKKYDWSKYQSLLKEDVCCCLQISNKPNNVLKSVLNTVQCHEEEQPECYSELEISYL